MSLATSLPPLLGCAALWFGLSLLVGACANALPLAWLQTVPESARNPTADQAVLRRYERWLGIQHWKAWIPDAGNALPGGIRKASLARRDPHALRRLIAETRRAELVHWALWPAWVVTAQWLPPAGVLVNLLFASLFNLPCLLLQRYNRLRLQRVLQGMARARGGLH
jgi:glycosyl-4,4'-diaponeurosporenoate acyltransferase